MIKGRTIWKVIIGRGGGEGGVGGFGGAKKNKRKLQGKMPQKNPCKVKPKAGRGTLSLN